MSDERDDKAVELLRQIRDFNTRADILGDLQGHYGSTGNPDFAGELADILRQIDELSPPEPTLPDVRLRLMVGIDNDWEHGTSVVFAEPDALESAMLGVQVQVWWKDKHGGLCVARRYRNKLRNIRPLDADADGLRERYESIKAELASNHDRRRELAARPDAKLLADVEPLIDYLYEAGFRVIQNRKVSDVLARVRAAQADLPTPPSDKELRESADRFVADAAEVIQSGYSDPEMLVHWRRISTLASAYLASVSDPPKPPSELAGKIIVKPPMGMTVVERCIQRLKAVGHQGGEDELWHNSLIADLAKYRDTLPGVTREMLNEASRLLLVGRDYCTLAMRYEEAFQLRDMADRLRAATNAEGGAE